VTIRRRLTLLVLVAGLLGTSTAATASRPLAPAPAIVVMQVGLYILGFDPGPIDGFEGPRTIAALAAYAEERGIVLNQATLSLVLALLQQEMEEELRTAARQVPLQDSSKPLFLPIQHW
jgi:peptidoglycan hydrolase-like protein with peptidoglycan-binding domain